MIGRKSLRLQEARAQCAPISGVAAVEFVIRNVGDGWDHASPKDRALMLEKHGLSSGTSDNACLHMDRDWTARHRLSY